MEGEERSWDKGEERERRTETHIERERLYRVFRKSIQPAVQVFNELHSLVI